MKQPTTPTTPFAMRCTQEQFDDVKEELKEYQRIIEIDSFDIFNVLYFNGSYIMNISDKDIIFKRENLPIVPVWDKSLFLKMAGKTDPESRELIGYKINTDSPITAKELGRLLDCSHVEMNGLFFWEIHIRLGEVISGYLNRAQELGIVGEGKWLVPVYKPESYDIIDLKPLPQSEVDRIKEATFIRGTPEWQKSVREIDVTKEPVSEQLIRTLNDDEVLSLTQNCKLNMSDYVKYLSFKKGRFWNNKTDTTNMKPTQYDGRITGTYEQQKGGEG